MADGSDDPAQIDDLTVLVERGVVVAAASRYMAGGQQVGGPFFKGLMSRLAGWSLYLLARTGTHDATNSFKAYSRDFVSEVGIDSRAGFEIGLELTAKARRLRRPVAELPTIWLDRTEGESNFKIAKWLPVVPALVPLRLRTGADRGRDPPPDAPEARHRHHHHQGEPLVSKVLVTGSAGFIGGYVVEELLAAATTSSASTTSPSTARSPSRTTTTRTTGSSRATRSTSTWCSTCSTGATTSSPAPP